MMKVYFKPPTKRCCKVCEITKPIEEFPTNRNVGRLTFRHRCIVCEKLHIIAVNRKNYLKRLEKKRLQ